MIKANGACARNQTNERRCCCCVMLLLKIAKHLARRCVVSIMNGWRLMWKEGQLIVNFRHGNPNYAPMTGLISKSMRARIAAQCPSGGLVWNVEVIT